MSLNEFVAGYQGCKVYYKPNMGNGGDALIAAGVFKLFRNYRVDFEIISQSEQFDPTDKIIFYPGGGNLVKEYNNAAKFLDKIKHSAKEIVVLPHTINSHSHLLRSFGQNVTLFAREVRTFDFLKGMGLQCRIFLDHDTAFMLDPDDFIEYSSGDSDKILRRLYFRKILSFNSGLRVLNAFRLDVESVDLKIPYDNIDVSNRINYRCQMDDEYLVRKTVADIFKFLRNFDIIYTNRLHIAIAAALLNKTVWMYPNSYWKNKEVYHYSISQRFEKVKFID